MKGGEGWYAMMKEGGGRQGGGKEWREWWTVMEGREWWTVREGNREW